MNVAQDTSTHTHRSTPFHLTPTPLDQLITSYRIWQRVWSLCRTDLCAEHMRERRRRRHRHLTSPDPDPDRDRDPDP